MNDDARRRYRSASQDKSAAQGKWDTPQTRSHSYRLAFDDPAFLLRDELRPVRLQLELLKPELGLQETDIASTIVVFGSARTRAPEVAEALAAQAEKELERNPADPARQRQAVRLRHDVEKSRDYAAARAFARLASGHRQGAGRQQYVIVTGGGPGIMEAANRGAHDAGAPTVGLNIVLPEEQVPNPYITPELSFRFHYFALRKMHFLMRARALVCFPGGYGTFDELFETLTLIQTGKIDPMPVLLFREGWWRRIIDFEALAEEGMIHRADLNIFQYVETAEAAWNAVEAFYRP